MTATSKPTTRPRRYQIRRHRRSGHWWIVDPLDGMIGPYKTRREAREERNGLERFDRVFSHGCRRRDVTIT